MLLYKGKFTKANLWKRLMKLGLGGQKKLLEKFLALLMAKKIYWLVIELEIIVSPS